MKGRFLILIGMLAMATGCAATKPVAMTPVAAEPDPWAGFSNGTKDPDAKPEAPKAEAKTEAKPESKPTEEKSSDTMPERVASAGDTTTSTTDEDVKPVPVKKAGKKKAKRGAGVAGKKPRKRAKKTTT